MKRRESGDFHGCGDEGEGAEDVGELGLDQGVAVSATGIFCCQSDSSNSSNFS